MSNSSLNNFIFFLDGDLAPSGTSVPITVDVELKQVVSISTPADATMIAEDGSQVERFMVTATGGTMTITQRGIKNDASGTSDNALRKQRYAGQKVFVTVHAAHIVIASADNLFSGNNTFSGTTTFTGIVNLSALGDLNVLGKSNPWAVVSDVAARDLLYPSPLDGDHVRIANTKDQVYNGGTGQREDYDIGTPPPNASETAKGLTQQATLAQQGLMTEYGSSGAPLFINPKNLKKASGTIYTSAYLTGGTSATSVVATWNSVTNGSFRITIDGTQRDITGLNFSTDTTMDQIAARIQTGIRTATGALETVIWSTNKFIISSVNTTNISAITVTSAVGSGTDISGAGATDFMDCDTGHGVVTAAVSNPAADENYIPVLGAGGKIDVSFLSTINTIIDSGRLGGVSVPNVNAIYQSLFNFSGLKVNSGVIYPQQVNTTLGIIYKTGLSNGIATGRYSDDNNYWVFSEANGGGTPAAINMGIVNKEGLFVYKSGHTQYKSFSHGGGGIYFSSGIIYNGYVYSIILDSGTRYIYKGDISSDLSTAGAWNTNYTISGYSLDNNDQLAGAYNGYIYIRRGGTGDVRRFTDSGSALVYYDTLTLGFTPTVLTVNDNGFYDQASSKITKYSHGFVAGDIVGAPVVGGLYSLTYKKAVYTIQFSYSNGASTEAVTMSRVL